MAVGWFQGTLSVVPSIIIILMLGLGVVLVTTVVAFSSPDHDAEADALGPVLQRLANGELLRAAV